MARYIDADVLKAKVRLCLHDAIKGADKDTALFLIFIANGIIEEIDMTPTIDLNAIKKEKENKNG